MKKQYSAGDTTTFTIYREGSTTTVDVTWDSVPAYQQGNKEEQTQQSQQGQSGGQYGGGYNPFDSFFRYFYGY